MRFLATVARKAMKMHQNQRLSNPNPCSDCYLLGKVALCYQDSPNCYEVICFSVNASQFFVEIPRTMVKNWMIRLT